MTRLVNAAVATLVVFCFALVTEVKGFSVSQNLPANKLQSIVAPSLTSPGVQHGQRLVVLRATADDEEEGEDDDADDDDDELDDASLGDWRKFRASLIDGETTSSSDGDATAKSDDNKAKTTNKSVAAKNEALLAQQNEKLAKEYRTGVWAHTISQVEVGGMLCRMPLEAELYMGKGGGYWKEKLDVMLSLESKDRQEPEIADLKLEEMEDAETVTVANVLHWFATAERMVTRELQAITESGKIKNGVLNPNDLGDNERILLDKYLNYKQGWQEICLVTSHNPESGCSQALVLNRPITKSINKQLAQLLLDGSDEAKAGSYLPDFYDKVVEAFGKEAGVYMGGPDDQKEPAMLIHGISNLLGATELAPGTSIYQGGLEAAVEGVLDGTYEPLEFRFFLGKNVYDPRENPKRGNLAEKAQNCAYQPVACARSLALKQCLGLPKPLWHEVLELCGGELKALSSIELRKRVDLQK